MKNTTCTSFSGTVEFNNADLPQEDEGPRAAPVVTVLTAWGETEGGVDVEPFVTLYVQSTQVISRWEAHVWLIRGARCERTGADTRFLTFSVTGTCVLSSRLCPR